MSPQHPIPGKLGVITKNVVSMRAEPDSKSEQTTQGLLGQPVYAEGGQGNWLFVHMWDSYRAWIPADRMRVLESDTPYASTGPVAIIRELFVDVLTEPIERAEIITKATIAVELEVVRVMEEWVQVRLPNGRHGFVRRNEAKLVDKDYAQTIWLPEPRKLTETAMRFVGVPYLWGGTSPFGLDCSGFVQLVYKVHGVTLLRDANLQAGDQRAYNVDLADLAAGDLVFFSSSKSGRITHVGMMLDREQFIHSCGDNGVTITALDEPHYKSIYSRAVRMRLDTLDPGGGAPQI